MESDFTKTGTADPIIAPTYTVADVNRKARGALEESLFGIWIEAEVTEVTKARSGHIYYKLSDSDGRAQIDAVIWRGQAMRYGSKIKKGARIKCKGRVTLYEAGGRYQFITDRLEAAGAGDKAKMLAELRARLEAEGLFDAARKQSLPAVPLCIGVVTSKSGAALQDIIKVISRRFPVRLLLAHAKVQGEGASDEVADGIELLGSRSEAEVIIIGRGGGSSEDLDAFNTEVVVRAIAACPVPIISAVGHEIDITLADLAADKRGATPSEAAELAVPEIDALALRLDEARLALKGSMKRRLGERKEALATAQVKLQTRDPRARLRSGLESLAKSREALARWPSVTLGGSRSKLDNLTERLRRWPATAIFRANNNLVAASEGVYRWPDPAMEKRRGTMGQLAGRLDALSPLASLNRGYSVVRRSRDGLLIKSYKDVTEGDKVEIKLAAGRLLALITQTEEESD